MGALRAGLCVRIGAWLAATTALTAPALAFAQPAPRPGVAAAPPGVSAPELNPAARLPRAPASAGDVFAPEPPGPCPLADSPVEVTLRSVTFRGSTALHPEAFADAYKDAVGKPQKVGVICQIRDRAARILFDHGILARVEIPEQKISGGALTLEVIEAHVVNVRVRGDIGPAQGAVERYVERLRGMKPFDMRKAQRYLLLASDIPGVRVRAAVKPSTSPERGAVDIDVTVSREPWQLVGNAQNLGSKTVGRWSGLLRGDARAFTPLGEDTSLVAFHTLDSNEQWVVQLLESARIGSDGWVVRGAAVYGESRPGDILKPLDLKSTSLVGEVEAAYPLVRHRRFDVNLAGGFDYIDQETDLGAGGAKLSQDNLRVFYLRADTDARTQVAQRPVVLSLATTFRKGVDGLGASREGSPLLTRALSQPDAWLVRAQGSAEASLTDRLSAAVRVQAQYTDDRLAPYEQLSLGDLSVGRGYDPAIALGDSGAAAALDVRYGPFQPHRLVLALPFAFFDAGYVRNNDAALSGLPPHRSLRSVGAGVVLRVANRVNVELTYAHPLDSVTVGGVKPASRLLVNLTASFL
jgi:hemolysin activation/secretion protein